LRDIEKSKPILIRKLNMLQLRWIYLNLNGTLQGYYQMIFFLKECILFTA
jgi:hypothetical protein